MTRILRAQGLFFCALAIIVAGASAILIHVDPQTELVVAAVMILLLGVPHGALDMIFARKLHRINSLLGWACFSLVYGILAVAVVAVWSMAPAVFLIGFLLISAAHFSGDPAPGALVITRVIYGGAVIILPTLLHPEVVARLFAMLAGPEAADMLMPWLIQAALPWFVLLVLCSVIEARRSWQTGLELLAVGLLATLPPPLIGFTAFFCGMHSARHILRTVAYGRPMEPWMVLASGLVPMGIVLVGSAVGWLFLSQTSFDARLVQLVFVGLAALTVPHMALIERVRLSGWS
jgi:Brp/Blh family beta-carotene 15,15'-monooxygenase